jgi:membrane protease YdiL (CAAX protease family)
VRVRGPDRATWRVFGILMAGAFVGVVGILPYALTLLDRMPGNVMDALPSRWVLIPLQVLQTMILLGAATALGLWLGPKVDLGAPLLYRLVSGDREARSQLRGHLVPSVGLGVLVGVGIVLLDRWVFAPRVAASGSDNTLGDLQPPAWQGLLASFYGAIPEELLLRLGLMTLLVWVGARLTGTAVPRPFVVWAAIVITALLFGAGHLPTTAVLLPLTPLVIARALLLNGIGGIIFGWLYWKRGLLAAMVAHFSADIVLHVLVPVITRS